MFQPKLLALVRRMQNHAAAYLEPTPNYISIDCQSSRGSEPNNDLVGIEPAQRNFLFANDMVYLLDGPQQREAQEEAEFDYVAETDVTASGVYGFVAADAMLLLADLKTFVAAADRLDKHKKVLFRKRTQAEAGLPEFDSASGPCVGFYFVEGEEDLLHGIIGVATEAGELAEIAIKKLEYPSIADVTNVREEIGDVLWYLARLVKFAGTTFLAEMFRNIAKLRARHGASFNAERDVNRNLAAERVILEGDKTYDPREDRVHTQVVDFPDEPHSGIDPK